LDEAFKKVEEKITDLKTKEVLQNEINQIIQQIEKVGDLITDEEQLKR
jgi:DNA-binding transcriptional regulator GbsR (MarR family)